MWIVYAFSSALFAGITSILAKIGIRKTDSDLATAIRTIVVLLFAWIMVFVKGSWTQLPDTDAKTLVFLILSGIATGASWLCYFRALQLGDVNKVVPIDKLSTVITMLFAFAFLHEDITFFSVTGLIAIGIGTLLMVYNKSDKKHTENKAWIIYATLSAVFAALTSILGKIGISGIDSNLGTAIRTGVVLIMAWLVVMIKGKQKYIKSIDRHEVLFICLSGVATGISWLCYYKALQDGKASVVAPIDKLSILVTVAFTAIFLKEKLSVKAVIGLIVMTAGTLILLI